MQPSANFIDSLTEKVSSLLSGSGEANGFQKDLKKNVRAVVASAVSKLDIVSKEEFDAQAAVLKRSREKIDKMEQQLAELTAQLDKPIT